MAAYDPATAALWIVTSDDESRGVIVSKVTLLTAGSTDFALAASTPGWFHGGVFPVADGSLWLAYGLSIVHFDPASKAERDVDLPQPGSGGSAPITAAVMVDNVIWVAQIGFHQLGRYSTALAKWLTPVRLPFEVIPQSELLVAGSSIVIDGVATTATDGGLSFVSYRRCRSGSQQASRRPDVDRDYAFGRHHRVWIGRNTHRPPSG
jgi:hypothetical protein